MANPPRIRNYQDLRYKFMRGLIRHEHQQRRHQFLKQAAEWTSKAIVSLSLAPEPIRSAKQATQLEGVGAIIRSRLDKIQAENNIKPDPPNPGRHVSTGSGLLVALLNEAEALGSSEGGKALVPEPDLKDACELICDEKFNKIQTAADGTPVLCPAWWRINVLISRGYVKKRTRGKQAVYELLPEGEQVARRIRGNHPPPIRIRNVPPLPQSPATKGRKKTPSGKKKAPETRSGSATETRSGNPNTTETSVTSSASNFKGPLYCHDRGTDGILMLVDDHELGGDRVRLGELCRRLKEWDIQHKTTHLPCGDYLWLWRENGKEVALPILVERKRADDLAESIKDGRFLSQKDKMKQWKEEFGMLSDEVSLQYVVESTPEAYRVKCMDGCNGVGKCGNPTVQQVEIAVKELENSLDFTLIKTNNLEITIEYLASITAELQQRVTNGDFQALRLMNQDRPLPLTLSNSSKSTASNKSRVTSTSTKTVADPPTTAHVPTNKIYSTHAQKVDSKTKDFERTAHAEVSPSASSSSLQNAGSKRRSKYIAIDIDDILEDTPKKAKNVVDIELLDDSQEDYLLERSPFDASSSKPYSIRDTNSVRDSSSYMKNSSRKYSPVVNPANQVQEKSENDEEAKIAAIRDVIPDASLDAILGALCSSGGNVEMAVVKLLG